MVTAQPPITLLTPKMNGIVESASERRTACHSHQSRPVGAQAVVDYNVRYNPAGIRYFARWKNCKWRLPEHPCCPQNKDKSAKLKKLSYKK